jgi:hypothetical protein
VNEDLKKAVRNALQVKNPEREAKKKGKPGRRARLVITLQKLRGGKKDE